MKKLLAALLLALLASLLVVGVAYASHGTDYARGNVNQGASEWRFSAQSNFNGTDADGTVRLIQENVDPNLVITGEVTCLQVVNGSASIVAEITDVRGGPGFVLQSLIIETTDTGKFSPLPDTFRGTQSSTPASELCPPPVLPAQLPVEDGEVVVRDSSTG